MPVGVTSAFCASRSRFCLSNYSWGPAGFGLSSVESAPELESSSRLVALSAAKCFQCTVRVPSIRLGKSLLYFCFSRALISSAKSFVGACCFWTELFLDLLLCRKVTVAGLHCQVLPMYCQSTFNLFWTELFLDLLLCRRVTVAGLQCLLPSTS